MPNPSHTGMPVSVPRTSPVPTVPNRPSYLGTRAPPVNTGNNHRISPGPTGPHHAVPNRMAHPAPNPQSRVSPVNSRIPTGPNGQQSRISPVNTGPHSRISLGPTGPHHAVPNMMGHPGTANANNQQSRISPVNVGPHRRISPGPNGQQSRISPVNAGPHRRVSPVNVGSHSRISPGPSPPQNVMPHRMAHPGTIHPGMVHSGAMHAVAMTTQGLVNYPPNMAVTTTTWYPPHDPRHYNVAQSVPRQNVPTSVQNVQHQLHTQMMNMQGPATSHVQRHQGPTSPLQVHIVPQIPGQGARLPVSQQAQQSQLQGHQVRPMQGHQVHPGQQVLPGQGHPMHAGQHVVPGQSFPTSSQANMAPWPNPHAPNVAGPLNARSHQGMPAHVQSQQNVGVHHSLPTSNTNGPSPNTNNLPPSVDPTSRITQLNQSQTGHVGQTQNGGQTNEAFSWYNMKHQTPGDIKQGDIKLSPTAKLEKSRIKGKVDPSTIHIDPENTTPHLELPSNSNVDIEVPPNAIVIQPEDDLDYPGTPPPCMSPIRDDLEDSPPGNLKIFLK